MKKLSIIVLSLIIMFQLAVPSFATEQSLKKGTSDNGISYKSNENGVSEAFMKVSNGDNIPVIEYKINLLDSSALEVAINNYKISEALANDLRSMSKKAISNYFISPESFNKDTAVISYFTPKSNINNRLQNGDFVASSVNRRTYTGYNNYQYMEEVISGHYLNFNNEVVLWDSSYNALNDTIDNLLIRGIMTFVGGLTVYGKATSTVASLLGISTLQISSSGYGSWHKAAVEEYTSIKYTYIIRDGQYYLGSKEESSQYRFYHQVYLTSVPGVKAGYDSFTTQVTPYYLNSDYNAYYGWINPIDNRILQYKLDDVWIPSSAY